MRPRLASRPAMVGMILAVVAMVIVAIVCLKLAAELLHRDRPLTGTDRLETPGFVVFLLGVTSTMAIVGLRLLGLDDTGARYRGWRGVLFGDLPSPVVVIGIVLVGLAMAACAAAQHGVDAHLVPTDDPSCQYREVLHGTPICRSETGRLAVEADYQRQMYAGMTGAFMFYAICLLSVAFDDGQARRDRQPDGERTPV